MSLTYMLLPATLLLGGHVQKAPKVKIKDITIGKGAKAKAGDTVTVDYTGTLTNGKKFDSSIGREPFSFTIGEHHVIKGWELGVPGMKVGGFRKLVIPSELAYGPRAMGPDIPANSTLIFTIKLLKIEKK